MKKTKALAKPKRAGKAKAAPLVKADPKSALTVFELLLAEFPNPKTELNYENPFQLLIAVILSAQCTDERVNKTTPALFAKYPNAKALGNAEQKDVEKLIHSCGFYRAKSKAIISTSKDLFEKFGNEVPRTLEELVNLRGVGRKTASVVLNQAYDLPAIAVDTHVARVSHRLGWTDSEDPVKIEFHLRELFPEKYWATINTLLILHGRRICKARHPLCPACPVKKYCRFYKELTGQE